MNTVALHARRYTSRLLDERQVVRLVPEPWREAEDIALHTFGLTFAQDAEVGRTTPRTVGFPAWPILNDPANARHALNLVGEMRSIARRVGTSPGPARDAFLALASRLQEAAPHFVPTLLEEAARAFLDVDNRHMALRLFGQARQVEREHNVPVDEERHRAVLLEFALAGALGAKELRAEARAVAERLAPEEALSSFVELNVQRVVGGKPPYAGMRADVRRLAKAAGIPPADVEPDMLARMLPAPALTKAPASFWKDYAAVITSLVRDRPALQPVTLRMFPTHLSSDDWGRLLVDAGAAELLADGTVDPEPWVLALFGSLRQRSRWDDVQAGPPSVFREILAGCDWTGRAITLERGLWAVDPSLLETLLAGGATILCGSGPSSVPLVDWLGHDDSPDIPLVLAHPALRERVERSFPEATYDEAITRVDRFPALLAALHDWVLPPGTDWDMNVTTAMSIAQRLSPLLDDDGTPATHVDLARRVRDGLDVGRIVAATLRDGLIAELAWPAMEAAASSLPTPHEFAVDWPAVGVFHGTDVVFVAGDREVARHSFVLPAGQGLRTSFMLVEDAVACCHTDQQHDGHVTWSTQPGTTTPQEQFRWRNDQMTLPVPGGMLTYQQVVRPGEPQVRFGDGRPVSDGTRWWWWDGAQLHGVDPSTGRWVPGSFPEPFATWVDDIRREGGRVLDVRLQPASDETLASPLGAHDGLHGWLLLADAGGNHRAHDLAGAVDLPEDAWFVGAVDRPGGGRWLRTDDGTTVTADGALLDASHDPDGAWHLLEDLPTAGLHHARPRDLAASRRMRTLTADDVRPVVELTPEATAVRDGYHHLAQPSHEPIEAPEARRVLAALLGTEDDQFLAPVLSSIARTKALVAVVHDGLASIEDDTDATPSPLAGHPMGHVLLDLAGIPASLVPDRQELARLEALLCDGASGTFPAQHPAIADLLLHPEILLAPAGWPLVDEDDRLGALAALQQLTGSALLERRSCVFEYTTAWDARPNIGEVIEWDAGRGLCVSIGFAGSTTVDNRCWTPALDIPSTVQGAATSVVAHSSGHAPAVLAGAVQRLLDADVPTWVPERVERFAELTGWTLPAAKLFLSGMRGTHAWDRDFLGSELRELLGITIDEATAARMFLHSFDPDFRVELLAAGLRDPEAFATGWFDVEAMAQVWRTADPVTIILPDDVLLFLRKHFESYDAWLLHQLTHRDARPDEWTDEVRPMVRSLMLGLAAALHGTHPARGWIAQWLIRLGQDPDVAASLEQPVDGWPADPLASAPALVEEVRTHLDLDDDAARYFLQLLALADPTDRNVQQWNGWTPKRRKAAGQALLERDVVVEARRSRAGRSLFLPGGWLQATAPHLPMEVWKAPLYPLADAPKVRPEELELIAPLVPLADHFHLAWERYTSGDVPGYEELRTTHYRRSP
ncbi:hypothetical protein [uncultured Tessaracoccus sp.]|uniref:hypothetical protein n=1 Tax=uncultured Tessaracoccus sp. TaxID=905023 RepID=UPI0025FB959E|nr:hypothetical protein [uncultured Tessaracoccus sp.]